MKYIVYKVKNEVNDKIYIGSHKTDDIDDGYLGSGLNIKRAIQKYGLTAFTKEVLFIFDNETDMYRMEAELVNEKFVSRSDTYNIKVGGHGGFEHLQKQAWVYVNKGGLTKKILRAELEAYLNVGWARGNETLSKTATGRKLSDEHRNNISNTFKGTKFVHDNCTGKCVRVSELEYNDYINRGWLPGIPDHIRQARKQSGKYSRTGSRNGSYGKKLVNDPKTGEQRRVDPVVAEQMVSNGWNYGWFKKT